MLPRRMRRACGTCSASAIRCVMKIGSGDQRYQRRRARRSVKAGGTSARLEGLSEPAVLSVTGPVRSLVNIGGAFPVELSHFGTIDPMLQSLSQGACRLYGPSVPGSPTVHGFLNIYELAIRFGPTVAMLEAPGIGRRLNRKAGMRFFNQVKRKTKRDDSPET